MEPEKPAGGLDRPDARKTEAPDNGGVRVDVSRDGCMVQLSFSSNNEYASIELYDHLVRSIQGGSLRLDLGPRAGK